MVQFSQLQKPSQATVQNNQIDPNLLAIIMAQKDKKSQGLGNMLGQIAPQAAEMGLKMANDEEMTAPNAYGADTGEGLSLDKTQGLDFNQPITDEDQMAVAFNKKKKNGAGAETAEIAGGAMKGAQLGAAFGPVGVGVGALLGGLKGFFG